MPDYPPVLVRTYKGSRDSATVMFQREAQNLVVDGYVVVSESWADGAWEFRDWFFAALLSIIFLGIPLLILVLSTPPGTLTVTYQLQLEAQAG